MSVSSKKKKELLKHPQLNPPEVKYFPIPGRQPMETILPHAEGKLQQPDREVKRRRLTTDLEWSFKLKKDGLAQEDFSRFQAQPPDLRLCQLNILPWS